MQPFVKTEEFKSLNVGFALDEGSASPNDKMELSWAERAPWRKIIPVAITLYLLVTRAYVKSEFVFQDTSLVMQLTLLTTKLCTSRS